MSVVRPLATMVVSPFVMLRANDPSGLTELWDADDPVVKKHPEWFTDDLDAVVRRTQPKVETADAEPRSSKRSRIETATSEPALS